METTELLFKILEEQAAFHDRMADKLDGLANESRKGSWSTHQVAVNEASADDCRREAARLRGYIASYRRPL